MNNVIRDQMKRGRSVVAYKTTHPTEFTGARASALIAVVEGAIARLSDLGADQNVAGGHALAGTAGLDALVRAVRGDMILISNTARTLVKNGGTLDYPFDVPASRANDITITTGEAFFRELSKAGVAQQFLDWEIRPTFLADLRADLDAYEGVTGTRDTGTQERKDAVRELDVEEEKLIDAIEGLDTLFRNKFQNDKTALAIWREASHLERTRVHPKKDDPMPPPP